MASHKHIEVRIHEPFGELVLNNAHGAKRRLVNVDHKGTLVKVQYMTGFIESSNPWTVEVEACTENPCLWYHGADAVADALEAEARGEAEDDAS